MSKSIFQLVVLPHLAALSGSAPIYRSTLAAAVSHAVSGLPPGRSRPFCSSSRKGKAPAYAYAYAEIAEDVPTTAAVGGGASDVRDREDEARLGWAGHGHDRIRGFDSGVRRSRGEDVLGDGHDPPDTAQRYAGPLLEDQIGQGPEDVRSQSSVSTQLKSQMRVQDERRAERGKIDPPSTTDIFWPSTSDRTPGRSNRRDRAFTPTPIGPSPVSQPTRFSLEPGASKEERRAQRTLGPSWSGSSTATADGSAVDPKEGAERDTVDSTSANTSEQESAVVLDMEGIRARGRRQLQYMSQALDVIQSAHETSTSTSTLFSLRTPYPFNPSSSDVRSMEPLPIGTRVRPGRLSAPGTAFARDADTSTTDHALAPLPQSQSRAHAYPHALPPILTRLLDARLFRLVTLHVLRTPAYANDSRLIKAIQARLRQGGATGLAQRLEQRRAWMERERVRARSEARDQDWIRDRGREREPGREAEAEGDRDDSGPRTIDSDLTDLSRAEDLVEPGRYEQQSQNHGPAVPDPSSGEGLAVLDPMPVQRADTDAGDAGNARPGLKLSSAAMSSSSSSSPTSSRPRGTPAEEEERVRAQTAAYNAHLARALVGIRIPAVPSSGATSTLAAAPPPAASVSLSTLTSPAPTSFPLVPGSIGARASAGTADNRESGHGHESTSLLPPRRFPPADSTYAQLRALLHRIAALQNNRQFRPDVVTANMVVKCWLACWNVKQRIKLGSAGPAGSGSARCVQGHTDGTVQVKGKGKGQGKGDAETPLGVSGSASGSGAGRGAGTGKGSSSARKRAARERYGADAYSVHSAGLSRAHGHVYVHVHGGPSVQVGGERRDPRFPLRTRAPSLSSPTSSSSSASAKLSPLPPTPPPLAEPEHRAQAEKGEKTGAKAITGDTEMGALWAFVSGLYEAELSRIEGEVRGLFPHLRPGRALGIGVGVGGDAGADADADFPAKSNADADVAAVVTDQQQPGFVPDHDLSREPGPGAGPGPRHTAGPTSTPPPPPPSSPSSISLLFSPLPLPHPASETCTDIPALQSHVYTADRLYRSARAFANPLARSLHDSGLTGGGGANLNDGIVIGIDVDINTNTNRKLAVDVRAWRRSMHARVKELQDVGWAYGAREGDSASRR